MSHMDVVSFLENIQKSLITKSGEINMNHNDIIFYLAIAGGVAAILPILEKVTPNYKESICPWLCRHFCVFDEAQEHQTMCICSHSHHSHVRSFPNCSQQKFGGISCGCLGFSPSFQETAKVQIRRSVGWSKYISRLARKHVPTFYSGIDYINFLILRKGNNVSISPDGAAYKFPYKPIPHVRYWYDDSNKCHEFINSTTAKIIKKSISGMVLQIKVGTTLLTSEFSYRDMEHISKKINNE